MVSIFNLYLKDRSLIILMPDKSFQVNLRKGNNCAKKLHNCFIVIFLSSLLGLLVAQFLVIQSSIRNLPIFLRNGNELFVNTNNLIQRNEPLFQNVFTSILLNSKQFNYTLLEVNQAIDIIQPEVLNLINYTENQLSKIDMLLNNNLNQLVEIDKSIKQLSYNNVATPSSSPVSSVQQAPNPTIPNLDP